MILGKAKLDAMPCHCCGGPKHGPMFLHGRCHPSARVILTHDGDIAHVSCGGCGKAIADIATEAPAFEIPTRASEIYYESGRIHVKGTGSVIVEEIQ